MNEIRVNFKDCVIDDGYMWVFDNVLQAICKIDLETMMMELVQKYECDKDISIGWIVKYESTLYMVTTDKPGILIYDRKKKRFYERFDAPEIGHEKQNISSVLLHESTIWIFPARLENVTCCYDIKKGKFHVDTRITEVLHKHKSSKGVFSPFYYADKNTLWMVCYGGNAYWKYDLANGNSELFEFSDEGMQLSGICCVDNYKWFSFLDSGKVMRIGEGGGREYWEKVGSEKKPFSNIVNVGSRLVFMPCFSDNIALMDIENGEIQQIGLKTEKIRTAMKERTRNFCMNGNDLYLLPYQGEELYKVDGITGKVISVKIVSAFHYELEQVKRKYYKGECLQENENMGLCGLIAFCNEEKECE